MYVKSIVENNLWAVCEAYVKTHSSCMFGLGSTAKISHCTFTNLQTSKCCYPGEVVRLNFYVAAWSPDSWGWQLATSEEVCSLSLVPGSSGFRKLCTQLPPFVLLLEPKGDLIFVLGYRPWSIKKTLIIFKNSDKTAWRSATHAFNPNKERRGSCCQPGLQIELRATHRYIVRPCFKQQTKKKSVVLKLSFL